jgi:hypothetical protein
VHSERTSFLGDAVVGASLGHESEDLALAVAEFSEWVVAVGAAEERGILPAGTRQAPHACAQGGREDGRNSCRQTLSQDIRAGKATAGEAG